MNSEPKNPDADWLAKLMGHESSEHSDEEAETRPVREALHGRARRLDETVPEAGDELFQRIRNNLKVQGVIENQEPKSRPSGWLLTARMPVWAAAAMAFMAAGLMLFLSPFYGTRDSTPSGIYSFATIVTAADPEVRMKKILDQVVAGASGPGTYRGTVDPQSRDAVDTEQPRQPQTLDLGNGRVMAIIEASPKTLQRLRSQDIEPVITDGRIVLIVEPK